MPVGDPRWGKPIRCTNPVHTTQTVVKLGSLSQLHPADTRIRLSDIKPLPGNSENGTVGNEAMLRACKRMIERPFGWLYLWGTYGNAKTVALKAVCNHLSLAGYRPVVYIKFSRLVDIIRDAEAARYAKGRHFEKNGTLELWDNGKIDLHDRLLRIKVLAIEEFDKARVTALMEEFRFDFLDDRYEQALRGETVTLFASQSPPEELPGALESRVNDNRFMVAYNDADDTRAAMQRKEDDICLP